MVGKSEYILKHGRYVANGRIERKVIARKQNPVHKDAEGQHVPVYKFIIPGVKKAEPLDAYGWITLISRVSSFGGIVYLVGAKLVGA